MINRHWDVFQGKAYGRAKSDEIRVTLSERAVFYLNKAAFDVMGQPAAVELRYDSNRRIIGIKAADALMRNAFLVRRHTAGNYRKVNASAFFKHFRIRLEGTSLFDGADFTPEGILELPMDSIVTVGRGAR